MRIQATVVAAFAFFLALGVRALPAADAPVEAAVLWREFKDDQDKAEARYAKGRVRVTGVVAETGMSRYATPNVRLSDKEGGTVYVICVLPRADVFKLSSFTVGGRATLSGEYRHHYNGPIVIKECRQE